jgi:hypothetical protein
MKKKYTQEESIRKKYYFRYGKQSIHAVKKQVHGVKVSTHCTRPMGR